MQHAKTAVRTTIRAVIGELAPRPDVAVDPAMSLVDDLDYHSLALLELAFALEEEFDLPPIEEAAARGIVTASDVENYVLSQLSAGDDIAARADDLR